MIRAALRLALSTAALCAVFAAAPAAAQLNVHVKVTPSCQFTTTDVAFTDYDGVAQHDSTAGGISVHCTRGTDFGVKLGTGNNPDASGTRQMARAGGGIPLKYVLYSNAAGGTEWNDTSYVDHQTALGRNASNDFPVYGRIPGNQDPQVGDYSDSVVVTIVIY